MGIDNIVNGVNQFTYTAGAVQGAAEQMVPAAYAVENSINQVASVFTGDTYQSTQPYPQQSYPLSNTSSIKIGRVGSILSGAAAGGITHTQGANALRSFRTEGIVSGLKNTAMVGLKAGAIGAGISGLVSGVKNMAAVSRGEITKADAGGNIAADTIGGLLAGSTGGLSAGVASLALSSFGLAGIPLTIGAAVAGAAGAVGANILYENTGARDSIAGSLRETFGGSPAPQGNAYGYYQ